VKVGAGGACKFILNVSVPSGLQDIHEVELKDWQFHLTNVMCGLCSQWEGEHLMIDWIVSVQSVEQ